MNHAEHAASTVARRLGIPCTANGNGDTIVVAPTGIDPNEGFSVHFKRQWRSAEAAFVPGGYARPLIRRMGQSDGGAKATFAALVRTLPRTAKPRFLINGASCNPIDPASWPAEWATVAISLVRNGIPADEMHEEDWQPIMDELILPLFAMAVSLIGIDGSESDDSTFEGERLRHEQTRYERRKINREICLQLHGYACSCCGMTFAEEYGVFATNFIEVHHITPVSAGGRRQINPAVDLIPVCCNCHGVLHLSEPPMPPEQLRQIIGERRAAK